MRNLFYTNPNFTCNHDMRRCTVNGKEMFCTLDRLDRHELSEMKLYGADVRSVTFSNKWATIEPCVAVDHIVTLVSDEPFDFGTSKEKCIKIDTYDVEYDPYLDFDADGKNVFYYW